MRRARVACLIAAVLALAGASAGPTRIVESTRFVVSLTLPSGAAAPARRATPIGQTYQLAARLAAPGTFSSPDAIPVRARRIEHSLFNRPPPARS